MPTSKLGTDPVTMTSTPPGPGAPVVELRRVAEASPTIAWVSAADGSPEYLNKQAATFLRSSPPTGWDLRNLTCCEEADRVGREWDRALRDQTGFDLDCRLRRGKGHYRSHILHVRPIRDQLGAVVQWFGTATDIDDTRQLRERLRSAEHTTAQTVARLAGMTDHGQVETNRRLAAIVEQSDDAIISSTLAGIATLMRL